MINSSDYFRFARDPPGIDAKRADHFLQADASGLDQLRSLESLRAVDNRSLFMTNQISKEAL